jgi:hypothetical protein
MVEVLVTPLVLAFASTAALGTVLTTGGLGMLAGSLVMSAWTGPKRRIYGVLGFLLLDGLCILLGGLRPSIALLAVGFFLGLAFVNGYSWAIWQSKVPPDIQGRVFATIEMIAMSSLPLGYIIAGPLADHFFEPLLAVGGPLAASIGALVGTGPGRGVGLLFIVVGMLIMLTAAAGCLFPRMRLVEEELPDAIPNNSSAAVEGIGVSPTDYQLRFERVSE